MCLKKKFAWGKVIDKFEYNFDGMVMSVIKYHPWKTNGTVILSGEPDTDQVMYSCEEINESSENIIYLVIAWIVFKKIGRNNGSLASGIARAIRPW